MTYKIDVTIEDIVKGIKHDERECPVAIALLRDALLDSVYVTSCRARVNRIGFPMFKEVRLPDNACRFIKRFDCDEYVRPISFEIEL